MKTAVEWLLEQLETGNFEEQQIAINKAKEMEKEQMRSASCPYIGGWEDDEFEYWYKETFKKQ
jgi:hypothetical protein